MKERDHFFPAVLGLLTLLAASMIVAAFFGSADLDASTVLRVLESKLLHREIPDLKRSALTIIWDLRLPRALLALAIGGALAVSGACMQSITQNVLADPYILGVSSGALLFVSFSYFVGGIFLLHPAFIPLMAFAGAIFSLILIYTVGRVGRGGSTSRLILTGMAISITLNAVSNFFIFVTPHESRMRSLFAWTLGGLASARWDNLPLLFSAPLIGCLLFYRYARAYDLMSLGEETAVSLGVDVRKLRRATIVLVAFVCGISVAGGGLIGLVGFIIPHIVRHFVGTNHQRLIPAAFLSGGIFLLWADILARTLMAPEELPIGLFTAICGGPFFVWILRREEAA
ncbi:MAG: iron ABC transporter permease [Peptostreptococcaceae bacterium]|nr:iron ABC transporter permease [Peptostreptococcaceae bacterium]